MLILQILGGAAMAVRFARPLAFASTTAEGAYWVERLRAEAPNPSQATLEGLYRCRPERALVEGLRSENSAFRRAAAQALWNVWSQGLGPENESRLNEATMMFEDGLTSPALALAETWIRALPGEAEGYSLRARICFAQGRYEQGAADCRKVRTLNSNHWPTARNWAAAARGSGHEEDGWEARDWLAAIFPEDMGIRRDLMEARDRWRASSSPKESDAAEDRAKPPPDAVPAS
ncbi:MAG: hypothetical protein NTW86_30255 [Candidatus Sumerlaeota bacterium]|nr:hypothetical protein [Candidatus Sumerlaeota bacterium]